MKRPILGFVLVFVLCAPAPAAGVRLVVPTRDIVRGEVVAAADLTAATVPGSVPGGTVLSAKSAVGMEARRLLHAGESFRVSDLKSPVLVVKGSIVTMIYEVPGVTLSAAMRAISAGGMGETVTVQNPVSFRQVGAVVTGPGQVRAVDSSLTVDPQVSNAER
jgi:flagellar basal body P-ring formation protein FlgA